MRNNITVRKFSRADRERVRMISCDTAFLGRPAEEFFEDGEVLADALTGYFTDYEPDSCFVAVADNEVIGYLIGAKDVRLMRKVSDTRMMPRIFLKALFRGIFFKRNTNRFLLQMAASFFKGEFNAPDIADEYPATLHINIGKDFRGQDAGKNLIKAYLDFLAQAGIKGVHFGSISEQAKGFFLKMGFNILFSGKRSYFKYKMGIEVPFYIFGKKLP